MVVIDGIVTLAWFISGFGCLSEIHEIAIKSFFAFVILGIYLAIRFYLYEREYRREQEFALKREYKRIAEREVRKLGKL